MRQPHITTPGTDTFLVSIESFEDGAMRGVLDSVGMTAPARFNSLPSLIIMIDNILDQQEEALQPVIRQIDPSFVPTMELEVLFRHNHTWQGRVRWDSGQKQATFKSVLELLIILEMAFGD